MANASANAGQPRGGDSDCQYGSGAWPAGLIGMLGLVLGVEWYVARHDAKLTTVHASDWRRSGQSVPESARCAVIGFGDSLIKHGVAPPVLEARLGPGRTAYNLAAPNGQAPGQYFLLRRLLWAGARPSAVLIDGERLDLNPLSLTRVWPELAALGECAELAWEMRDANFLAMMVLARLLPSHKAGSKSDTKCNRPSGSSITVLRTPVPSAPSRGNSARRGPPLVLGDYPSGAKSKRF